MIHPAHQLLAHADQTRIHDHHGHAWRALADQIDAYLRDQPADHPERDHLDALAELAHRHVAAARWNYAPALDALHDRIRQELTHPAQTGPTGPTPGNQS